MGRFHGSSVLHSRAAANSFSSRRSPRSGYNWRRRSSSERNVMIGTVPPGRWRRIQNPVVDERAVLKAAAQLNATDVAARIAWIKDHHAKMLSAGAQFWRSADYLVAMVDGAVVLPLDQRARCPPVWWLRIYRHDGKRIRNHWSEVQRIKRAGRARAPGRRILPAGESAAGRREQLPSLDLQKRGDEVAVRLALAAIMGRGRPKLDPDQVHRRGTVRALRASARSCRHARRCPSARGQRRHRQAGR